MTSILGSTHRFYLGLDLGQKHDFTAFSVIHHETRTFSERDPVTAAFVTGTRLTLRHAERIPLKTSYPEIVNTVERKLRSTNFPGPITLAVDATGVGVPVVDLLRRAHLKCQLMPIVITGGQTVTHPGSFTGVPRRDLITNLQVLFEKGRLRIAQNLPMIDDLAKELAGLRPNGTTEPHDDLAFSLALAAWPCRNK